MAQLNYEIPEALHRALKTQAATRGVTLKNLVTQYLFSGLRNDREWPVIPEMTELLNQAFKKFEAGE